MKKTLISTCLMAASFLPVAHAADGTITFNGEIITAACTIESGDKSQTVNLGKVSSDAFPSVGSTASVAPINISLSACDSSISNVSVRFDGQADATNPQLLALTTGGARGVGIALYEKNGSTPIPINSTSAVQSLGGTDAAELNFVAKYMSTAPTANITAGPANSVAQFTIDYN